MLGNRFTWQAIPKKEVESYEARRSPCSIQPGRSNKFCSGVVLHPDPVVPDILCCNILRHSYAKREKMEICFNSKCNHQCGGSGLNAISVVIIRETSKAPYSSREFFETSK